MALGGGGTAGAGGGSHGVTASRCLGSERRRGRRVRGDFLGEPQFSIIKVHLSMGPTAAVRLRSLRLTAASGLPLQKCVK
jgi:hypothetical protein